MKRPELTVPNLLLAAFVLGFLHGFFYHCGCSKVSPRQDEPVFSQGFSGAVNMTPGGLINGTFNGEVYIHATASGSVDGYALFNDGELFYNMNSIPQGTRYDFRGELIRADSECFEVQLLGNNSLQAVLLGCRNERELDVTLWTSNDSERGILVATPPIADYFGD